jgi:hypothetical protein
MGKDALALKPHDTTSTVLNSPFCPGWGRFVSDAMRVLVWWGVEKKLPGETCGRQLSKRAWGKISMTDGTRESLAYLQVAWV